MAVKSLGVIGAGTMGGAIAFHTAAHGLEVSITDARAGFAGDFLKRTEGVLARWVDKGRMSAGEQTAALARLTCTDDLALVAKADLVIEAVFEDIAIKRELLARLDPLLGSDSFVATNTSALKVADLAASLSRPERMVGLHYFSPAEVNPLCELVRGPQSAAAAMAAAGDFLALTKRAVLECRDSPGFVVNRFFCPYTNEAARIWDEGIATPAEVDLAAKAVFGAAIGPFAVQNIIKPRINVNAVRNLSVLGAFYAPAEGMVRVGDSGENYVIGEASAFPSAAADRLMAGTFLPVLQLIDEGVASGPDIDRGAELALKWSIPPFGLMKSLGAARVEALVAPLCVRYGLAVPASIKSLT